MTTVAKQGVLCALLLILALQLSPGAAFTSDDYERAGARPDVPLDLTSDGFDVQSLPKDEPQQIHVSMAGPNRMRVSWLTVSHNTPAVVQYGVSTGNYTKTATGETEAYTFIGYKSGLIHHVVLGADEPLKDSQVYFYRCGERGAELSFKTPPPAGPDTPINFSVIGDLGQTGWSTSTLAHISDSQHDMVILAGDLSYADRWASVDRPGAQLLPRPLLATPCRCRRDVSSWLISSMPAGASSPDAPEQASKPCFAETKDSRDRVYDDVASACGAMHVTIGDGGNREGLATRYLEPTPNYSLKREASFGHGELQILNATTARWTWHRNQDDEAVIADEVIVHSLGDPANTRCPLPGSASQKKKYASLGRKEKIVLASAASR
eukprot:jgi/Mesen1/1406/ME000130S00495